MINNIYTIEFKHDDEFNYTHETTETIKAPTKELALKQLQKIYDDDEDLEILNVTREPNVGLAVIRGQCTHNGHIAMADKMHHEMDIVIIASGSTQEHSTINNPWTPKHRRTMWEKIYGKSGKHSKLKIIELRDIGAVSKIAWSSHVFGKIDGLNLPKPTHYYAGSKHDASWFDSMNEEFGEDTLEIVILDRYKDSICMSGTEIRKSILDGSDDWKEFVPSVIVDYVEETFPYEAINLYGDVNVEAEKAAFEKRNR